MNISLQTKDISIHPLTPLSPSEIEAAVSVVRRQGHLRSDCRIQSIWLVEPDKDTVLNFKVGDLPDRRAVLVILDRSTGATNEVLISISSREVLSETPVEIGQPAISLEEFQEAEELCRNDERYRAALAKRGITDLTHVIVDLYGAGAYGDEPVGRRLARGLSWIRLDAEDNPYAHPIDNVHAIIDLNAMEIVAVEDYGVVAVPQERGSYALGSHAPRTDLKPLEIVQAEGPSFELNGHSLKWQKWSMRIGCLL